MAIALVAILAAAGCVGSDGDTARPGDTPTATGQVTPAPTTSGRRSPPTPSPVATEEDVTEPPTPSAAQILRFLKGSAGGAFALRSISKNGSDETLTGRSADGLTIRVELRGRLLKRLVLTTTLDGVVGAQDVLSFVMPSAGDLVLSTNAALAHTGDFGRTIKAQGLAARYETHFVAKGTATLTITRA